MIREWQATIDVSAEWRAAQKDPEGFHAVAWSAIGQLLSLPQHVRDLELELVVLRLLDVAQEPEATSDDFDEAWEVLYDWADAGRRLWIERGL